MNTDPLLVPENATPIPSAGLVNRMRGQKVLAMLFSPLAAVFVVIGVYLFFSGLFGAKSGEDWMALVAGTLVFGPVVVFGIARPIWRLYKFGERMEKLADLYEPRAIVLTPDYIEIFVGVMHENCSDYYDTLEKDVARVPWDAISSIHVDKIPASQRRYFRGLVIAADSLSSKINGEIHIELRHFEACEEELLAWIAHYRHNIPVAILNGA